MKVQHEIMCSGQHGTAHNMHQSFQSFASVHVKERTPRLHCHTLITRLPAQISDPCHLCACMCSKKGTITHSVILSQHQSLVKDYWFSNSANDGTENNIGLHQPQVKKVQLSGLELPVKLLKSILKQAGSYHVDHGNLALKARCLKRVP